MRTFLVTLICLIAVAGPAAAAAPKLDHPGVVALSEDNGKFTYTSFPDVLPLYIFEGDERGKSKCDRVCAGVWPILGVLESAKPAGDWTIIQRDDGRRQWAYKGMPVYTFYDDRGYDAPKGEGLPFGWWLKEGVAGPAPETYAKYKTATPGQGPVFRRLVP